jgi:putative hydrolase of the HAD superfamily
MGVQLDCICLWRKSLLKPDMIFFDAAGTLIEVRGGVGDIYSRFARQYGLELAPGAIQARFAPAFRRQPPMAFPAGTPADRLQSLEWEWWRTLVRAVFAETPFPRFEEFFAAVFAYFGRAEAWSVFEDAAPALDALRARGVRLAVISNFDGRLEGLLGELGLAAYFDAIHLSTRLGAEKPDPAIFRAALQFHGVEPERALHVGDRVEADVDGAIAAGMRAVLVDRAGTSRREPRIARLDELMRWL